MCEQLFEAIKAGLLLPIQNFVEEMGPGIFALCDDKGHTPAHWACLGGHTDILRFIIDNKGPIDEASQNELGSQPIHWAAVNGNIPVVDILMQSGVSLDVVDLKGCTPLIVACQYGQTMLAVYLMAKGTQLQLSDKDGDNALHWASFKGHCELMRLLIYSGFNPKQRDNYWQTPLHLACINGNLTAVKELCEEDGVEINMADKNGKTPLMLAAGRKHEAIVNYLKKEARFRSSILPRLDFWAILFGPPGNSKGPLIFFVVSVLMWGYPMYIFKCIPMTFVDHQYLHILFFLANISMWISLYHANTIDPGFLPRNIPEYDQAIRQVAYSDEWREGSNPLKRLCHSCRTVKPIRAKHCRFCNRCVCQFDHHCPYIHNCVGFRNRHWFFIFMSSAMLVSFVGNYFVYVILFKIQWDWLLFFGAIELTVFMGMAVVVWNMTVSISLSLQGLRLSFVTFSGSVGLTILFAMYFSYCVMKIEGFPWRMDYFFGWCLLMFFAVVSTFIFSASVLHAALNITTNERINMRRYDYLKDGAGRFYNPYDNGMVLNLLEFCHLRKQQSEEEVALLGVDIV